METTQITKDTLASMSLDDLHAERWRQVAIRNAAEEVIALCAQAIADRTAEFKAGDLVVDADGIVWQVTRIEARSWPSGVHPEYHGRRIKKDGSAGGVVREIYRCPLRAANSGNDGGTD
ncbi:MAG: hypothetical protein ACYCQL_01325 [Acidithiobacillus sp.]